MLSWLTFKTGNKKFHYLFKLWPQKYVEVIGTRLWPQKIDQGHQNWYEIKCKAQFTLTQSLKISLNREKANVQAFVTVGCKQNSLNTCQLFCWNISQVKILCMVLSMHVKTLQCFNLKSDKNLMSITTFSLTFLTPLWHCHGHWKWNRYQKSKAHPCHHAKFERPRWHSLSCQKLSTLKPLARAAQQKDEHYIDTLFQRVRLRAQLCPV